ncbi:MAG TPA: hypothetical protein VGP17_13965 [Solirubrobacteraceae bacterium]|nr:hypothetical protein [Solirubrobacteraceae bacterium]
MSIVPIQQNDPVQASCPNCGAAVAADQHYCLNCGRPCSPLRLPFLEVLQSGPPGQQVQGSGYAGNGYLPPLPQSSPGGPLQRYTGLFTLIGVLLLTAVIGLLIGHWAFGSSSGTGNGPQVVKIEGLAGTGTQSGGTAETTTSATTSASNGSEAKSSEHETKQEAKETKEAKLPPAKKDAAKLKELSKESGKQYSEKFNELANSPAPIETGG